jgi:histidyl-tRNA synthetase
MFRYERAQAGRYRQHSQMGAEVIGSDDALVDAELIDLLTELYSSLGVPGVTLYLTSIGDPESRADYAAELGDFLLKSDVFDADQRSRIEVNPLRAFDWDAEEIRELTDAAPKMVDRLGEADREHFAEVRRLLESAGIEYELDPRLVRGLDYYTRTVFEFRCDALGAQSGIGGGGRYDKLVEQIGGDPTPAAGWATGLERIAQALDAGAATGDTGKAGGVTFMFAVTEPAARERSFGVISELRRNGMAATIDLGGRSLKGQMKQADRLNSQWAVIIGPEEWSRDVAAVRDLRKQEQEDVPLASLVGKLLDLDVTRR